MRAGAADACVAPVEELRYILEDSEPALIVQNADLWRI